MSRISCFVAGMLAVSIAGLAAAQVDCSPRAGGGYELQYARPLFVMERCVTCHGDAAALAPEVKALIAGRYPQDAAVGYRAGDLRGAISVRLAMP